MRVLALAIGLMILAVTPAAAHQSSIKYVDIAADGTTATVRFTVAPNDVTEPMGQAVDSEPALAAVLASPAVAPYVAAWLAFDCAAEAPRAEADADGRFVVVVWRIACPTTIGELHADFSRFFAVDQRHEAIVTFHLGTAVGEPAIVRAAQPIVTLRPGERPSIVAWIRYGMDHIYSGRDHICFVLALLFVVVLVRTGDGWAGRTPLAAIRSTATIITAFTVAHSLSLIAASLGWLRLPSQLVESLIAVSIAYTAVEDIVRPDVRWRFVLTFGFGLIHGLGFASVLEEMLPPDRVIVPLLAFNLGVELGQLTIVLVVLPVLWLACRELGATRYRRMVMPGLASVVFLLGIVWLVERVAGITILGM